MDERRSQTRTNVDWRVKFAAPGEEWNTGFLGDLNAKGLSILGTRSYPAGTEVNIHFGAFQEDPDHQFQLRAVVRHTSNGRMGLQFLEGPVTDHEKLLRMMRGKF